MPKKAKELSALTVARIKDEGRHAVGGVDGLHLRVVGDSRNWVLRVAVGTRTDGKGKRVAHRRDIGLGGFPDVPLAEAREKARAIRKQVRDGADPIEQKKLDREAKFSQRAKQKTFRECSEVVIANKVREFKNAKHSWQWQATLETYAYPLIGDRIVTTITKADVAAVLAPIWQTKNETASRLRGRIEAIFDYAKAMEYREGDNPAAWKGTLEPILGNAKRAKKNHPSLPYSEVGAFMAELRNREGISARTLEFAVLTAARTAEARGATWAEIDLRMKKWTIPGERMKGGKEHRVPLSDAALELLQALPHGGSDSLVFPAPQGGKLSDMTLVMLIRRLHGAEQKQGRKGFLDPKQNKIATTHGFRATFKTWAREETSYPKDLSERALAHTTGNKVEEAYDRGDLFQKRARLMADWARYCGTVQLAAGDNIIPIGKGAA
jgi:integrase